MSSYSNYCSKTSFAFYENQLPQQAGDNHFHLLSTFLDPRYYEINNFLFSETLLPYLDCSHPQLDRFPLDPYPCRKRQKCYEDDGCCSYLSDTTSCMPEFQVPQVSGKGKLESEKKNMEKGASARSVDARERRRKITDKTRELGKLIPGGTKMNTSQMLQAAFKYVKFLQAQVQILDLLASLQEKKEARHVEELQILASAAIQEKLCMEKCLVPEELGLLL